jgi:hypothetical protein
MATVSYGTITITDLTDITDVYLEYCMVEAGRTASEVEAKITWTAPEREWGTTYPTWQSGYEIWIRQVQIKEGVDQPEYGTPYLDTAVNQINITINAAEANITALQSRLKKIWTNLTNSTSYPAGTYAASGINDADVIENNSSTYGYNTFLNQAKLALRYNAIDMTALTTNALTFYIPTQENDNWVQGKKGLEITAEGIDIYNPNGKKGLDIKNDGLVIYDINVTPVISAKQNIFSLGFDTNKYNENFNPADPANLDPFIIWTKQESNEEEIYSLYECVDDIYLRIDENSETQKYSLRNKLKEFNNNIININSSISDIQSDIEDNIKMDIKQLKADVGTNTNNILINTQAIKKIKAYWFIGENEHLTLKEEALNNGL